MSNIYIPPLTMPPYKNPSRSTVLHIYWLRGQAVTYLPNFVVCRGYSRNQKCPSVMFHSAMYSTVRLLSNAQDTHGTTTWCWLPNSCRSSIQLPTSKQTFPASGLAIPLLEPSLPPLLDYHQARFQWQACHILDSPHSGTACSASKMLETRSRGSSTVYKLL